MTLQLQGIGKREATPASELKVGDVTVWNYGYKEVVTEIAATKSGKSVKVTIESLNNGRAYSRTFRNDRLVVVEKA